MPRSEDSEKVQHLNFKIFAEEPPSHCHRGWSRRHINPHFWVSSTTHSSCIVSNTSFLCRPEPVCSSAKQEWVLTSWGCFELMGWLVKAPGGCSVLQSTPPHLPGRAWHNHGPHRRNQGVPKKREPGAAPTQSGSLGLAPNRGQRARTPHSSQAQLPPPPQQPAVMKSLPLSPACIPTPASMLTSHLAKRLEKPLTLPDLEFID